MSAGGRSRAAALALLGGVVMVVGAAVIVPAGLYWSKTGTVIRDARLKVMRAEQRSGAQDALGDKRTEWDAFALAPVSGLVQAKTDAEGIEATKSRIAAAFAAQGGSVTAIEADAADGPREGIRRIGIEVRGTVSRSDLAPLLAALESDAPYLMIERFEARAEGGDRLRLRIGGGTFRLAEDTP